MDGLVAWTWHDADLSDKESRRTRVEQEYSVISRKDGSDLLDSDGPASTKACGIMFMKVWWGFSSDEGKTN